MCAFDRINNKLGPLNSQHTLNHKDCPPCEAAKSFALRKLSMSVLGLYEAGELWLEGKRWQRRKPKSMECNQGYLNNLNRFFGDIPLKEIHAGSLLAYQNERSKEVGASCINHELNALSQILKQAGLWDALKSHYAPLTEPEWQKPEVLTFEEQQRVFDFAKDDPGLELAQIVFTITRNTSASGCELRLARHRQLELGSFPPIFAVTGDTTKNTVRPRRIPLNEDAAEAFRRAIYRASRMGSHRPEHFIFPYQVNKAHWDPNRPASKSWLRNQTGKLRERTNLPKLRPHLWRHQIATEMLEAGKPRDSVIAVCGWVSEKMIETYCHTRIEAKQDAISAVSDLKKNPPQKVQDINGKKIIRFPQK
jgi:integrase